MQDSGGQCRKVQGNEGAVQDNAKQCRAIIQGNAGQCRALQGSAAAIQESAGQ